MSAKRPGNAPQAVDPSRAALHVELRKTYAKLEAMEKTGSTQERSRAGLIRLAYQRAIELLENPPQTDSNLSSPKTINRHVEQHNRSQPARSK